jgi:hypothetical protein
MAGGLLCKPAWLVPIALIAIHLKNHPVVGLSLSDSDLFLENPTSLFSRDFSVNPVNALFPKPLLARVLNKKSVISIPRFLNS